MPFTECLRYTVPSSISNKVWRSLGEGNVFITRKDGKPFIFATGQEATLKADAELLGNHPDIISQFLQLYAAHPCVIAADMLSFVPNGTAKFTDQLGKLTGKDVLSAS
jgi:hypothetical protein